MKTLPSVTAGLISLALFGLPVAAHAEYRNEDFGKIFHSRERRAALDRQRLLNIQEIRSVQGATLKLNGIVYRGSGKNTVWVNGKPQSDLDSASTGVEVSLNQTNPGQASIHTGETGATQLKVGEAVNRSTGARDDRLSGGVIVRHGAR
jgi:hypothetical protein